MSKIDVEAKITMRIGQLRQDMMTAQDVVKEAGIDVTSPIAPILIQLVLNEIRSIRTSEEFAMAYPNGVPVSLFGAPASPLTDEDFKKEPEKEKS